MRSDICSLPLNAAYEYLPRHFDTSTAIDQHTRTTQTDTMIAPLVLAASLAAGLLVPAAAVPVEARDTNAPVQFTGYFPTTINCGSGDHWGAGYLVGWEGGSG